MNAKPVEMIQKIIGIFRKHGLPGGFKWLWQSVLQRLVRSEIVFINRKRSPPAALKKVNLAIRVGDERDFQQSIPGFPTPIDVCQARLLKGHTPYLALVEDKIAYVAWTMTANELQISYIGQPSIAVPERSVYVYDGYVLPDFRGLKIASYMLDYIANQHAEQACFTAVQSANTPSLHMVAKTGFQPCWQYFWLRCGPISLKWRRTFDRNISVNGAQVLPQH